MKNAVIILYFLAGFLLLFSCTSGRDYPQPIQQAIDCMEAHPDSALSLLTTLADSLTHAPRETQMYYHLLTIKAKDKLYIPHTTDSVILSVVDYYRKKKDKARLFESYFYLGSTYRDLQDVSRALKYYHRAAEIGENTDRYILLGMTYGQLGILFAYQGLYDESRNMMRRALRYYGMEGDSVRYANSLRNLARTFDGKGEKDSALYYYKESYRMTRKFKAHKNADNIAGEMGCFYFSNGQLELAKRTLLQVLPTQKKSDNVLLCLGRIYMEEGKMDSARYYFKETIKHGTFRKQCYAHSDLARLERLQGNEALASLYDSRYRELKDSIDFVTRADTVEKLHLLYSFQREEQKNHQLDLENEQYANQIYLLLFVLFLSLFLGIIINQRIRHKKQQALDQEKRLRLMREEQYKQSLAYLRENELRLQELEGQLVEAGKLNDTLRQQVLLSQKEVLESSNRQSAALLSNRELLEASFRRSDIYALFHQAEKDYTKVTEDDWDALRIALDKAYPQFTDRLYELYPKLSQKQLYVCYLIKLSLNCMSMAHILFCTPSAITQIRKRLYKKISGREGTGEDFDKIILDL